MRLPSENRTATLRGSRLPPAVAIVTVAVRQPVRRAASACLARAKVQ